MNKKYSDWLKIDLHIHTDKSKETKTGDYKGVFSVTVLKEKLIENAVEIFSLTDHNIINVEAYEEYYDSWTTDDPLLLLGVELDIQGSSATYHSLLIFNYSSKEEVVEISERLERKYTNLGITDKLQRKLNFEDIVDLFQEDDFFFIPHAKKGGHQNIVDATIGEIHDTQRMILLMQSALEKVTKQEMKDAYQKGFDLLQSDSFRERRDIAYINFSDNHRIEQYPCRHMGDRGDHEFDYIKGDKNYETLRLAFIDPESRIKSQVEYNQIDTIANKIEKIKIENEPNLEPTEIFFSPHLNVIIGGRSSGKSLLMNVLGRKIDRVDIKSHYKITDENFLIKSKDDSDYKEQTTVEDNLLYVNQGDIVRYFEYDELKSLAKDSHKLEDYDRASEEISEKKDILKDEVDNLIHAYGDLLDIGSQIKYELHQSTIHNIFSEEYMLKLDEDELREEHINSEGIGEAKDLVDELHEKTEQFQSNELFEIADGEKEIIAAFLALVETKQGLMVSKEENDTKKSNFLQRVKIHIDSKNSTLSHGAQEKARANEKLDSLKQEIKVKFQNAIALQKQSEKVESYNYNTEESISVSDDVSLVLSIEQDRSLKDILLSDVINNGEPSKSLFLNLLGLFNGEKPIKNLGGNSKENLSRKIDTIFGEVYKKFDNPKDYLRYSDGTTSKENSPGLNSEKYLEVVLGNESIKMVFIDQPEDNLGNKFISHTLVDIIRDIKFKKQIFLVTHNPAIAVYGDAECIIIAENTDNVIKYKQITLEDKEAQKEVCSVLDGGEYIFDNRSRKYNIQRILREAQNG